MNKSIEPTSTNNELFVWGVFQIMRYFIKSVKI